MNWFRENRFLGTFLVIFGVSVLGAFGFLFSAKSDWEEANTRFNNAAMEMNRLERLTPYPSGPNLRKMKAYAEDYSTALARLKQELKIHVSPPAPLAPNEFQTRLRIALNAVTEKARANKVKLPDKFYLGFDDFVSALPSEAAAPLLGKELVEIEWLMNSLLDAHVEAVTAFHRTPLPEERGSSAAVTPASASAAPKLLQRNVVEATFFSTAGATRRVINQIDGASQHFCIIRQLRVHDDKDKGPPREVNLVPGVPSGGLAPRATPGAALKFIVGDEKLETTAKIELVRFTL